MTVSAADSQKQRVLTGYKVLKRAKTATGGTADPMTATRNETWEVVASVEATSSITAIRAHLGTTQSPEAEGVYVAVAERSFQPQKVTVEQTTVVKVGEPT